MATITPNRKPTPETDRPRSRSPRALAAGQIVVVGLIAYGLAILLNSSTLVKMAERQRLGSNDRALYLDITRPVRSLAHALHLDWPHRVIDDARGKSPSSTVTPLKASPGTVSTVTTTGPRTSVPVATTTAAAPPGTNPAGTAAGTTPARTTPAATTAAPATPTGPRVPTKDHPLRLWIGGDSEAQGLGSALEALSSRLGTVNATLEYKVSSGLARPDYFDWPAKLAQVVGRTPAPEVMVIIFGGNDAQPLQLDGGKVYDVTAPQWRDEYRRRVAATMDLLGAAGRKVIWVGPPNAQSSTFTTRLAVLSQIYAEEAAKRPGSVIFVDSRPLFSDANGAYTAYLPDASGSPTRMRAQDGFHLSVAGAYRLAGAVQKVMFAAVPGLAHA